MTLSTETINTEKQEKKRHNDPIRKTFRNLLRTNEGIFLCHALIWLLLLTMLYISCYGNEIFERKEASYRSDAGSSASVEETLPLSDPVDSQNTGNAMVLIDTNV